MKRVWALVDQESELWALFETRDAAESYRAAFLASDTGAWFKADVPGWLEAFRLVSFALFERADTVPVNYRLSSEPMDP